MKLLAKTTITRTRTIRRAGLLCLAALATICASGCGKAPEEEEDPYVTVVGTRLLMASMLDPAADLVWDSVRTEITLEGTTEFQPQTEEEWTAVRNAAITLAESANLLMIGDRAVDQRDWVGWSWRLIEAGDAAMQAAESRDVQGVFDAGGEIYVACAGCHAEYWQQDFQAPPESAFRLKADDLPEPSSQK